jgi:hypothetical protein
VQTGGLTLTVRNLTQSVDAIAFEGEWERATWLVEAGGGGSIVRRWLLQGPAISVGTMACGYAGGYGPAG